MIIKTKQNVNIKLLYVRNTTMFVYNETVRKTEYVLLVQLQESME